MKTIFYSLLSIAILIGFLIVQTRGQKSHQEQINAANKFLEQPEVQAACAAGECEFEIDGTNVNSEEIAKAAK